LGSLLIIIVTFVGYLIAYHTYGRFLANRIFKLDARAKVPSREKADGVDYVPTRKGIIFGHHYTSIAGTGPIVGPAIGIIWGWVPALIWVFVGSIVMGAVHDLGAVVMSLRNEGKSIAEIVGKFINRRVRTLCFLIVFLELWIVIAIFGLVIAVLFDMYAQAVWPIWMELPIAIALGYMIYKGRVPVALATAFAVFAMYITVVQGHFMPLAMPSLFGMPATGVWTVILLVYAYFASTLPVTALLQPRDYMNSWQLFIAMGLLLAGAVGSALTANMLIVAPAFNLSPKGAPPIFPFLFVTIACGAISGFHSLVGSGTSSKQISNERDALFVGYGSMLLEGTLAVLVIIAVAAGIGMAYELADGTTLSGAAAWDAHYATWAGAAGLPAKVGAVVVGSANMMSTIGIPMGLGVVIMGVFIASFAGTTLDTATRIQRYVISEIASDFRIPAVGNRWLATAIAVVTAGILAFSTGEAGAGAMVLWPMFGAVNQLLAALALLLVTLYLKRKGGLKYLVTGIPCVFVLLVTTLAMFYNTVNFVSEGKRLLAGVNGAATFLALWMVLEGFVAFSAPGAHKAPDEN